MIFIKYLISLLVSCFVDSQEFNPHFFPHRSIIAQLFEWKFPDIAEECEVFLGPTGYGGVQVSPVSENIILPNRTWLERYQPIAYRIATRSGTEVEFRDMIRRCNKAGVRVYVDAVLNNMASWQDEMIGTGGSTASNREFPAVPYTSDEFHRQCSVVDYMDAHEVRNCEIANTPDLDHSLETVKSKLVDFLNRLINFGVAGFRIGGAKHMWPNDLKEIFGRVKTLRPEYEFKPNSRPFFYLEVIDKNNEPISKTEYNFLGPVTELLFSEKIAEIFRGNLTLSELFNWGPDMGFLPSEDSVVFVDNHDIQRGHGGGSDIILSHTIPRLYKMAIAFMLAHPYGIPIVTSSYKYENSEDGPPADDMDRIISPRFNKAGFCDENWICEHRWHEIANMIKFRNAVEGTQVKKWEQGSLNQISFCRGNRGCVAFNNDPESNLNMKFNVTLPQGEYCDVIANNCQNKIVVDANGQALIRIPAGAENGFVAYHVNSRPIQEDEQ